jgi:hypothetical protein
MAIIAYPFFERSYILMEVVTRLKNHYESHPPQVRFEGLVENVVPYKEWPENLARKDPGIIVWHKTIKANTGTSRPPDAYYVINECLDPVGDKKPRVLTLPSNMLGHAIQIIVYIDRFDRIFMRAIGGFTAAS